MDGALIGKALLTIASGSAVTGGGYYAYKYVNNNNIGKYGIDTNDTFKNPSSSPLVKVTESQQYRVVTYANKNDGYIYMLVNPETLTGHAATTTSLFETDKKGNYKCEVNEIVDLTCEIQKISLDKKQYTFLKDPSTNFSASTDLTRDDLKDKDKLFLLKINKSLFSQTHGVVNSIDVLPINPVSNEISSKFSTLKPIFVKTKTKTFGKANYVLAKVKTGLTATELSGKTYGFKCKISSNTEDFDGGCFINKFSDNATNSDYKEEVLSENLTSATELTQDRHYLFAKENSESFEMFEIKKENQVLDLSLTLSDGTPKEIKTDEIKFAAISGITATKWIAIVE